MNKFENEMYEFLKNGGDMEAYLNTITQVANAANARIQEEKKKEAVKKNIVQDADVMLATVRNFFHTYYPEVKINLGDEKPITGKEFVDMLEDLRPLFPMLNTLVSVEIENADRCRSATDPIQDFLDKFVRGN